MFVSCYHNVIPTGLALGVLYHPCGIAFGIHVTPTGLHCRIIGLCYHHATPLGLHLGYMSPLRGYIVVRLGFSIIMPPLWGCFRDSCHPCEVSFWKRWAFYHHVTPAGLDCWLFAPFYHRVIPTGFIFWLIPPTTFRIAQSTPLPSPPYSTQKYVWDCLPSIVFLPIGWFLH